MMPAAIAATSLATVSISAFWLPSNGFPFMASPGVASTPCPPFGLGPLLGGVPVALAIARGGRARCSCRVVRVVSASRVAISLRATIRASDTSHGRLIVASAALLPPPWRVTYRKGGIIPFLITIVGCIIGDERSPLHCPFGPSVRQVCVRVQ